MLSEVWTQLERLSAEIEDLHHRRVHAERHHNAQLARQLTQQMAIAEARRKRLVERITLGLAEKA